MLYITYQTGPMAESSDGSARPPRRREGGLLSASEVAMGMIRDLIESGELGPGARLNADELGERLGVSRTPVRDALQILRSEGLVDIQPRRGVFVRDISAEEIDEVYTLKASVEPIAAEWAAVRGADAAKSELSALVEKLAAAGSSGDIRLAAEIVDDIHDLIFDMAQSAVLHDVYGVLHGRVKWLRHLNMGQPGRLDVSVQHHSNIASLIIAGDGPAARKAMAEHMEDARASVRTVAS
jgi:DNA-binding GntR family transcriptional regulator